MSRPNKSSFKMMSFMHETLYGLFRDPYKALNAAGLKLGQEVLEVGCGPGHFTIPAAEIVGDEGSVLALDVNPLAVAHVQQKIEAQHVTNARTLLANAAETALPDESFGLIFVFGVARPIGGMEAIWAEMHRVLKPDGTLAVEGRLQPPGELFRLATHYGRIGQFNRVV
jgi:ubiquinone/menaquinone biosynthesis C-methylase UbiE